ncbi:PLP-dependent transferase, partial [Klebsiella pneumoniae]|uniref:PLP-dependent transferase n=1 Tax=Klebsiella pneumoniae TaxID=573 RepID=UPI00385561D7
VDEFTQRVCALEGAESGYATASGLAAVFGSFMALMKQGDHLLSCSAIFGSTHTVVTKFLPKYGIEYSYVAATATEEAWRA